MARIGGGGGELLPLSPGGIGRTGGGSSGCQVERPAGADMRSSSPGR